MLKNILFAFATAAITVLMVWIFRDANSGKVALFNMTLPLVFICFGGFISEKLGDSVVAFITLGLACGLEGYQVRIFGWFMMAVQIICWLFFPQLIPTLPVTILGII